MTDSASRRPRLRSGSLAGIRVADFCWVGVGSIATRLLADYGAEVIKIEHGSRLDIPRRLPIYKDDPRPYGSEESNPDPNKSGLFNNWSRNKLGVTVDMSKPEGLALAERLIRASSVVTENFAPGVMEKWGLTYEHLKDLSPEVIYCRMSGFGHSGPRSHYRSFGPVVQAVSGLSYISGLPGQAPSGWGLSYMDNQAAYYGSAGLLMAIFHRNATGHGMEVDVSAYDVGVSLVGPDYLDATVNHRSSARADFPRGNRLEYPPAAPHGVYPAKGEDQWVAIAVFDDEGWQRLVGAIGSPEWAAEERFATAESRWKNQDALDAHLSTWTRQIGKHEAMRLLQAAGVAAGAAQTPEDLNENDDQLAARGIFFEMDHPVIGWGRFEGNPMKMSRILPDNWRSAPLLGEDNNYVFGEVLGMGSAEIEDLRERGII